MSAKHRNVCSCLKMQGLFGTNILNKADIVPQYDCTLTSSNTTEAHVQATFQYSINGHKNSHHRWETKCCSALPVGFLHAKVIKGPSVPYLCLPKVVQLSQGKKCTSQEVLENVFLTTLWKCGTVIRYKACTCVFICKPYMCSENRWRYNCSVQNKRSKGGSGGTGAVYS